MNEVLIAIKEVAHGFVKRITELEVENTTLKAEIARLESLQITNTGSPKLYRYCLKLYACVRSGNDVSDCDEFVWTAA